MSKNSRSEESPHEPYELPTFRHTFGLIVPATNTSMEHDLWRLVFANQGIHGLRGVRIHTSSVETPRPSLVSAQDLLAFRDQFLRGLGAAVDLALLAEPNSLILGMSLEHILEGIAAVRASMAPIALRSALPWATWQDAVVAALSHLGAKRIGLLTPFDPIGNRNAKRMFTDLGYEVVESFGFACTHALEIARIPDGEKEKAIAERLATRENRLDAVVQCGTNMSILDVAARMEPAVGIPILGINAVTFWHALRMSGYRGPVAGGGRWMEVESRSAHDAS